jgi:hypothetical protein
MIGNTISSAMQEMSLAAEKAQEAALGRARAKSRRKQSFDENAVVNPEENT